MLSHVSPSLTAFIKAAELGSFAAAGREIGISPAAIGQNIKRLEDGFGVKLFNRTTRKISLTPEGELIFRQAKGPLAALADIEAIVEESRGVVSGRIRVSAPAFFARRHLAPIIKQFSELHPKVEFEIDSSDAVRDLVDDAIDISFRIGTPADSTFIARPISDLQILTLAAPSYLAQQGKPDTLEALSEHSCLRYRFPKNRDFLPWTFKSEDGIQYLSPSQRFVFNDPEMLISAAISGLGLVQMDSLYAADALESRSLVPVLTDFVPKLYSLHLIYPSRELRPLRIRAFLDFINGKFLRDCFLIEV
ncbi:MAG: LysR family transcriptional regulator [Parasphingorhabdus sp.]|uniref:LysR family transcriptional regulator n=1 Tax=Parasphingorhabdus sp. TaxID=2709688 RepID=UPI003298DD1E